MAKDGSTSWVVILLDHEQQEAALEETLRRSSCIKRQRIRNFDARNERTVTGTLAASRSKGGSGSAERKQGDCYQWKAEGKCSKGSIFAASATTRADEENERETTCFPLLHRCRRRETVERINSSKGGSPRGTSPSGRKFQQSCQKYSKELCTDPWCDDWHPPECQRYKTQEGCSFSDLLVYLQRKCTSMTRNEKGKTNQGKDLLSRCGMFTRRVAYLRMWMLCQILQ